MTLIIAISDTIVSLPLYSRHLSGNTASLYCFYIWRDLFLPAAACSATCIWHVYEYGIIIRTYPPVLIEPLIETTFRGVHLPPWCTSPITMYISHDGVHLPPWRTSPTVVYISYHGVHIPSWRTSPTVVYISHHGVHLPPWCTYPIMVYISHHGVHLPPWCTSPIMVYISHHGVHPPPWCKSHSKFDQA